MAAGDLKGDNCIVIEVTAGAAVAKGDLVHIEADDKKWDPTADADVGKFGVANTAAAADGDSFMAVIYGPVEVATTAAAIGKGQYVEADAKKVKVAAMTNYGEVVGTAMESVGAAGGNITIFVGMM